MMLHPYQHDHRASTLVSAFAEAFAPATPGKTSLVTSLDVNFTVIRLCTERILSSSIAPAETRLWYFLWLLLGLQLACALLLQPWYSRKVPPLPFEESQQLPDNGQRIALTAGTDLLLTNAAVRKHKHSKQRKDKKSKKVKNSDQEAAKAKSVEVLRAERQAREQAERARQDRLLRAHRGFAQPAAR